MEMLQAAASFVMVILVASAVMQVVTSYALQVLSEKNELPEFASFLSWIPILNIYPVIRNGGGSFRNFILGVVGFVLLGLTWFTLRDMSADRSRSSRSWKGQRRLRRRPHPRHLARTWGPARAPSRAAAALSASRSKPARSRVTREQHWARAESASPTQIRRRPLAAPASTSGSEATWA